MQDDLLDLLRETAFDPDPVDLDDIRRDAHHLRRNRRAAALGGAAVVAALVATAIFTVAGSPGSPVIGPAPSPSAAIPQRLDTDVVEVLAATQTDDRTLKGHVVTDQDGLESLWEMFNAGSLAPGLPDGAGALVVAADGCHALHGVTGVEIRDSIGIALVEEDPRVGRAGCDRTVFAIAIPADIADRLTGADAAVQTASTGNSPPDQADEPAVRWWHRTLGGGGVSDHGHWAVANQDTVFATSGVRANELVAVDLTSGQERWRTSIDSRGGGLPQAATDVIVIVSAQYRDVYALDAATGETVWELELDDGYGAASAVVTGDGLLLVADSHAEGDHRPPRVLAVDLADGAVRWETELRIGESVQWAPPTVVDGRVIVATTPDGQQDHDGVHALDVNTGELQWTRDVGPAREYTSYTEVAAHVTGNLLHLPISGPATVTLSLDTGEVLWESDGAWPLGGSKESLVMTDGQGIYTVDPTMGEPLSERRALQLVDTADWLISIDAADTVVAPTVNGIAILEPTTGRTSELHPTGVPLNRVILRGELLIIATQDRGVLTIDPESRQPASRADAGDPAFAQSCPIDAADGGAVADVDGDGRMDRVSHYWDDEKGAALVVCTADGVVSRIQGMGQAESMEFLDVDGDGAAEILFGATSVQERGAKVARWHNDEVAEITTSEGEPLLLRAGGGGDHDNELGWAEYSAFGCGAAAGDGGADLVQGAAKRTGSGYRTSATTYTIRETIAIPTAEQTAEAATLDEWLSQFTLDACAADRESG